MRVHNAHVKDFVLIDTKMHLLQLHKSEYFGAHLLHGCALFNNGGMTRVKIARIIGS